MRFLDTMKQTRCPNPKTKTVSQALNDTAGKLGTVLKPGHFILEAPLATSVKLAASFTEWERHPVNLDKSEDGRWFIVLPLPAGEHAYRYIVDGHWHNDPLSNQSSPNPFGGENSLKIII